jgi:hypothetical protein
MKFSKIIMLTMILSLVITGCESTNSSSSSTASSINVEELLQSMTLAAKIGQMINSERNSISSMEAKNVNLGGVFIGGGRDPGDGSATSWISTINSYQNLSLRSSYKIPLLYGTDAVHGNLTYFRH